jgi:hypothetical protein
MSEDRRFETMKMEYVALRAEILQSISYQHQILLAGYGATGVFISYVAISSRPFYLPALIFVPFILLGMASLWIVECNRMVRASYYIGRILWRGLRAESEPRDGCWRDAEWECWIRCTAPPKSRTDRNPIESRSDEIRRVASEFRDRQHRSQKIVVFEGPAALSAAAALIALLDASYRQQATPLELFMPWALCGLILLATWLWSRIYFDLKGISDLGETRIPAADADGTSSPGC